MGKLDNITALSLSPGYDKLTEFFVESGMDVIDEINHLHCSNTIPDEKGDFNELENRPMDDYEDHHEYDVHYWCTTLIGVSFEIVGKKNHEHRWVVTI